MRRYIASKVKSSLNRKHIVLLVTPILGSLIFFFGGFSLSGSSSRAFLSTLVTAQVSLLSIVFALLILGFNLISDKYGVRVNQLIRKNALFWITGIVFLTSVALNLVSLLTMDQTLGQSWMALLGFSIGMTVNAGIVLFLFVNSALKQTQPREILELIEEDNQPQMLLDKMDRNAEKIRDSEAFHPLYPLHRIAVNSLERGDVATGKLAVRRMRDLTKETIEAWDKADDFPDKSTQTARQFIKPITQDFLPEVAYEYLEEDYEVSHEAIESIREIGQELVGIQSGHLVYQANYGLDDIMRDGLMREDESYKLVNKAMREKMQLLDYWVNKEGFNPEDEKEIESIKKIIRRLDRIEKFPTKDDDRKYRPAYGEFFNTYPSIVEGVLGGISYQSAKRNFRWYEWRNVSDGEGGVDPYLDLVSKTIEIARNSVGLVIKYKNQNNHYPMADGDFYRFFEQMCSLSDEVSIENRKAFCIMTLEASVQFVQLWEDEFSNHILRRLKDAYEENPEIMDKAIEDAIEHSESGQKMFFFKNMSNQPNFLRRKPDDTYYTDANSITELIFRGKTSYDNWLRKIEKKLNGKNT